MKFTSPTFKTFIEDIVFNTDEVDVQGTKVPRTTFKKSFLKGIKDLRKLLRESADYVMLTKEDHEKWLPLKQKQFKNLTDKEQKLLDEMESRKKIVPHSELDQNKDLIQITGKYSDREMVLEDKALLTVQYYYKERDEIAEPNDNDIDLIDQL